MEQNIICYDNQTSYKYIHTFNTCNTFFTYFELYNRIISLCLHDKHNEI